MNKPIQVKMLLGPQRGKAMSFETSPLTFGRRPNNTLIVPLETASRLHGELRFERGQWLVENHSENVISLRGRRISKGKMATLQDDDVVSIGRYPVFQVRVTSGEFGEAKTYEDEAEAKPRTGNRRLPLWIGIGVYVFIMLGLMVYLRTLGGTTERVVETAPELTSQEIEREIRDIPLVGNEDQRRARELIDLAGEQYQRITFDVYSTYEAHRSYKLSLAYSKKDALEGIDQRRYKAVEDQLIQKVVETYQQGVNQMRSKQYHDAIDTFTQLKRIYPDTASHIYTNIEQHQNIANQVLLEQR